jgi:quercetin dioxygenase-like cupin family protein
MIKAIQPKYSFTYSGAQINVYHANKGEGLPKHEHKYAHATMCCSGSFWIRKEGKEVIVTKDTQPINLLANEWHEAEAAENNTVFLNVFAEGKY